MRTFSIAIAVLLGVTCIPQASAQFDEAEEEAQEECEYARDEAETAASELALAARAAIVRGG